MQEGKNKFQPDSKTFDRETLTLLLHINKSTFDLGNLPDLAEKNGFDEKSEYHITVLGFKTGEKIQQALEHLTDQQKEEKISEIQSLVDATDWSYVLKPEKYHITKHYPKKDDNQIENKRESYIQMVRVSGIDGFFKKLNELLKTSIEVQPAHITLYTSGNEEHATRGIGINSPAEFEQLDTQPIK
ncbi:hypothetical protein ACFL0L_01665 [Patescibacteria group bacterium]